MLTTWMHQTALAEGHRRQLEAEAVAYRQRRLARRLRKQQRHSSATH